MSYKLKKIPDSYGSESFILSSTMPDDIVEEFLNTRHMKHLYRPSNADFRGYTILGSQLLDPSLVTRYTQALEWLFLQYCRLYPYTLPTKKSVGYIRSSTPFNVQHYEPGKYYSRWHPETHGPEDNKFLRAFVFMTYLNTVQEGGETEFLYQKIKVKPKRGLTLVWPAGITHIHRGCPAPVEEKMIVTGWFIYPFRLIFEKPGKKPAETPDTNSDLQLTLPF